MANHLRLSLGIACAASLIVGCVPRPALPVTPPAASTSTTPATTTPDVSRPHPVPLVNQLRQGGYVLYIRHAKTDFAQKDTTSDYDDCTRQRNLTDEGRAQATAIGVAFKQLGIPVGRVVASPYCRTRETAQLAFGKFERATHYEVAKSLTHDLLAAAPAAGPNTIIVAHGFILRDIAHLLLNEGDAVVFKPRGNGDQNAIARVPAKLWTTWAAGDNAPPLPVELTLQEYDLPAGVYPHDVAPAGDSTVWFTAQNTGQLGRFDPRTGKTTLVALGDGSHPHGVIVGADGAAWVTDGGLNAIVRVDAKTEQVKVFPLPKDRANTNLNTAAFDANGRLWFTGQSGIYGRLDTTTGKMDVWDAPRGAGP